MRLDYELALEDLIAHGMYTLERSPVTRRGLQRGRVLTILTLVALSLGCAVYAGGAFGLLITSPPVLILAVALWVLLPRVYRDRQQRHLREWYKTDDGRKLMGRYVLSLTGQGVVVTRTESEVVFQWSGIGVPTANAKHGFLPVPGGAYIIPFRGLSEEQRQDFVQAVEHYRAATSQFTAPPPNPPTAAP
jgi:hypothetical protein